MADWWSPLISSAAALVGVAIGGWLTRLRDREERRNAFLRQQLEEFYAPFCALRQEIRAKGEVRVRVAAAIDVDWRSSIEGISPERLADVQAEKMPTLDRSIAYDNEQLRAETIPAFKRMLALFQEKLWLIEDSTREHYPALVEFVEVWNRYLAKAIPSDVPTQMGHGEDALRPLYEEVERHRATLSAKLRYKGGQHGSAR